MLHIFETIETVKQNYLDDYISKNIAIKKLQEIGEANDEESAIDIINEWDEEFEKTEDSEINEYSENPIDEDDYSDYYEEEC